MSHHIYIKSSLLESISYLNFDNIKVVYKKNWLKKAFILLIVWDLGYKNFEKKTNKPKNFK